MNRGWLNYWYCFFFLKKFDQYLMLPYFFRLGPACRQMGNNIFQSIPFLRQLEKLKNVGLIHISIYDSWGRVHSIQGKLGNFSGKLHDSKHLKVIFLVSFESYGVSRWNLEKYCCYSMENFVNSFLVQFGWCHQKNFFLLPVTSVAS